ncbi:YetF domain-containing protein [Virgibacillus sp. W0181]|uniref:YetF domain-containing protein n=1 Tax=Virgibacillus sp. W0181 TaxID=3391581 RepID=UPI003F4718B3
MDDVQYATIEVSGQLGYELKENKKPLTKEDYNTLINEIAAIKNTLAGGNFPKTNLNGSQNNNLFKELKTNKYEGKNEP